MALLQGMPAAPVAPPVSATSTVAPCGMPVAPTAPSEALAAPDAIVTSSNPGMPLQPEVPSTIDLDEASSITVQRAAEHEEEVQASSTAEVRKFGSWGVDPCLCDCGVEEKLRDTSDP